MKLSVALLLILALLPVSCTRKARPLPNIIFILADDLGYGDLSCLGQEHFETPNIDRLAAGGMMLTRHYSGSTVCAPSRSALMTGLHTGHTSIRGNRGTPPEGQWPLPDSAFTLAELLKQKGYTCGAFGKWGLGGPGSEGDPLNQGFDVFYGYNCQTLAHNYYPYHLWSNREKIILTENEGGQTGAYAPMLIQQKALEFLEANAKDPFFLYYATTLPHAELAAPEEYMARYRNKLLPEKSYRGADQGQPRFRIGGYASQPEAHAAFAAMVNLLDDQVGELIDRVRELGLSENTLVIFSSDNGPHLEGGADPDYFNSNGPFRGYKRDLYEGGIRVPTIAWWPGQIDPGSHSGHVSAFWDFLPTFAELTHQGLSGSLDGISLLPTLQGRNAEQKEHEYLYWEFHEQKGKEAILKGDWKLVRRDLLDSLEESIELYNIELDPAEQNDLAGLHPEKVRALLDFIETARTESEDFPFKPAE